MWIVRFHERGLAMPESLHLGAAAAEAVARVRGERCDRQPFVLSDRGETESLVNAYFASRRFRAYAPATRAKYAYGIGMWLNFCESRGAGWRSASPDDVADFKYWRMTDEGNQHRVGGSAVHGNLAAIAALYGWVHARHPEVSSPVLRAEVTPGYGIPEQRYRSRGTAMGAPVAEPAGVRDRNVKWLDPAATIRWIDTGLRGFSLDGQEIEQSRNRTGSRDAAFAHLLYGSGLRVQEAGSLLVLELAEDDPNRPFYTMRLAAACGKGRRGRRWWLPRQALGEVLTYLEGQRAAAVARSRAEGRYEGLPGIRLIESVGRDRRLRLRRGDAVEEVGLDELGPSERSLLFYETEAGLEPAMVWLHENGMPRRHAAWNKTFDVGCQRLDRLGLPSFRCTPHMLRHSFALRWYAIGRLLWGHRLGHLSEREQEDFRAQFGDTWKLVQTLLGHKHPQTTMDIYLEPFKSLEVELLFEYAAEIPLALLKDVFHRDKRILNDPVPDLVPSLRAAGKVLR